MVLKERWADRMTSAWKLVFTKHRARGNKWWQSSEADDISSKERQDEFMGGPIDPRPPDSFIYRRDAVDCGSKILSDDTVMRTLSSNKKTSDHIGTCGDRNSNNRFHA